ncbi:hypothetical protein Q4566_09165 [Tamlana sp. 2_MG-2023]|uniref:hypothetical protein n=1 Tax=unclassified Tamlana TaxID=2614803 RepID=UPI0026E3618F|nr:MULTISPECIES: hypothetical protein [unclassified Tamlana]MDO6760365.1 hypothetical protein [Tamlana sp. 2_MG-2023]MDO6789937.1 hypothetical protein [Tamlana sp. 1_MG-2023]
MIKKLVLVFIVIFAIKGHSQQSTASPYSYYGIGSLNFKGTVENRSMGGLSIYNDSIHVNLRNPASYGGNNLASWGGESRPVIYTVGGGYQNANLKSENSQANTSATTFNYLAMSFPIGKLGIGFGIMPYTSVGYKLDNLNGEGVIGNRFSGEGGLNKVFLGAGYQIIKELSIGVDLQYNFGNIQSSIIEFQYDGDIPVQYQTRENNRSNLSGFSTTIGASFKKMITERLEVVSGLTYTAQSNLNSDNERSYSTITINSSTNVESVFNTVDSDLEATGLKETELTLPFKITYGLGIGQPRSWFLGAEYMIQNTSDFSNPLYRSSGTVYENSSRLSVGGFFIPQYNSFSSYYKRIVYRAGVRFEETGLNINNQSIDEFGISFGVGLPVGESRLLSNANLGFEFGQRGTTESNLIQENFINFQISLSLNDRWFQKRKYD